MFNTSITRLLFVSFSCLMGGLLVAASILAAQAWSNYRLAERIVSLTLTDESLFTALVTARSQISKNSTALLAQDDPQPVIVATHRDTTKAVRAALTALQAASFPSHARYAAAVQAAWQKLDTLQYTVDELAARERTVRDLHSIDQWRESVNTVVDALDFASVALGNTLRLGDPVIAEMVQIRRTAWIIRDRYGRQCSLLRPNAARSQPLDASQLESWHGNRAIYATAFDTLDEFLLRPGVSAAIRARIDFARQDTQLAQERINSLATQFDGSGRPLLAGAAWTGLCNGPFESILAIAKQAQVEANDRAASIRAAAFRMLLVASGDLIAVIVFGVCAVLAVRRRLARPMKILIGAVAKLSRREFDEPVPTTGRPDELGELAMALETLRGSALEAERLQEAMSRFTADASHQMRTPLSILRTHMSLLESYIPAEESARSSFQDMQEAANRLQRLLIQLLQLARADGAHSSAEWEMTDLRDAVGQAAAKQAAQALEASIELRFEAGPRPVAARTNPLMLAEILSNLIDNAIRYNSPRGSVTVRLSGDTTGPLIEVEDDGPGIPAAERSKVLTRFYRMSRDQARSGSGLGLAIVSSLAALLDARIELADGAAGRGLRVRIVLPEAGNPHDPAQARTAQPLPGTAATRGILTAS